MIKRTTASTLLDGTKGADNVLNSTGYIEEIDISKIDEDLENEFLFGYNEVSEIVKSINEIGFKSVVTIYKKDNGRYQCLSGNSRIKAAKEIGLKKIRCEIVDAPRDNDEKDLILIRLNAQRVNRPLYLSRQIKRAEEIYRAQGIKGQELEKKLCDSFNLKRTQMFDYKKISTMHPKLQLLFAMDGISYTPLTKLGDNITDEQAENIYTKITSILDKNGIVTMQEISSIIKESLDDNPTPKEIAINEKMEDTFVTLKKLKRYNLSGKINIKEANRKEAKEIAEAYIEYFNKVLEACK